MDIGSQKSYLNKSELAKFSKMVQVLKIPYAATISFQKQDLTIGECLLRGNKQLLIGKT